MVKSVQRGGWGGGVKSVQGGGGGGGEKRTAFIFANLLNGCP